MRQSTPVPAAPRSRCLAAGITGLTTALNLKRAGKRVAVLEHHTVGSGTSGTLRVSSFLPPSREALSRATMMSIFKVD